MGRLDGKVAVITGAGAGLGRVAALLFAAEGASVVIAEVSPSRGAETAELVRADGGVAVAVTTDVSREADVAAAVETATSTYGRLDIMYNNAGIMSDRNVPIEDATEAQWRRILDVNAMGVFFGVKHAVPAMRAQGGGSIVVTSSASGLIGYPDTAIYTASKGAVNAFVRAAAIDLGRYNIRVNALCPTGGMSANFLLPPDSPVVDEKAANAEWTPEKAVTPLVRPEPPQLIDHARLALFLASDDSSYLTGLSIPSDGGTLSRVSLPSAVNGRR